MPFSPTNFINNQQPPISAGQLNKLGTQYSQAMADVLAKVGIQSGIAGTDAFGRVVDVFGNVVDSRAVTDLQALVASNDRYSNIYPNSSTSQNSLPGFLQAIRDTPDGGTLIVPPKTYYIGNIPIPGGGPLEVVGGFTNNRNPDGTLATPKSISIEAYGATFIQVNDQPVVDMYASVGTPFQVADIREALENTASLGGNTDTVEVISFRIDGTAPVGWVLGDRIRLFAEDRIPGGRYEYTGDEQRRSGADFRILTVTTDTTTDPVAGTVAGSTRVKVIGTMNEWTADGTTFSDNPRLVKFGSERISWKGGTFTTSTASLSTKSSGFIRYVGLSYGLIQDVVFLQSAGAIITTKGCYGCTVDNANANFATNNPGSGRAGYLVLDTASSFCHYDNLYGHSVRHTYTDDSAKIPTGLTTIMALTSYGCSRGFLVSNSTAVANISAGFSPHAQSRDGVFANCHVYDSGSGFGARGAGHIYQNVSWTNCKDGWTAFSENNDNTRVRNMVLDGFVGRNTQRSDIRLNKNQNALGDDGSTLDTYGLRESVPDKIMNGVIFNAAQDSVFINNSTVTLANIQIYIANSVTGDTNPRIIDSQNSGVRNVGEMPVFCGGLAAGTGLYLIRARKVSTHTSATSGYWRGGKISLYGGSSQIARFSRIVAGDSDHILQTDFYSEVRMSDTVSSTSVPARFYTSRGSNTLVSAKHGDGNSSFQWEILDSLIADSGHADFRATIDEGTLNLALQPTANRTLATLPAPNRKGQILNLWNDGTSVMTVANGSGTQLTSGANTTLAVGDLMRLRHNGTVWKQF